VAKLGRIIFAGAVLLFSAQATAADTFSGNELYQYCASNRALVRLYAAGLVDAHLIFAGQNPTFCFSPGVTVGQLGNIFCEWLGANPKYRDQGGSLLLLFAMPPRFFCSPKKSTP
jgi:Rap1a immunity proteins